MAKPRIRYINGDMPLDRWDGDHYVHATGREVREWVLATDGSGFVPTWRAEYEDDKTVNMLTTEQEVEKRIADHAHYLARDCVGWEHMRADFRDLDLSEIHLTNVDLSHANLHGVNLQGAVLRNVKLISADLEASNLEGTKLERSVLYGANLTDANLSSIQAGGSVFCFAQMKGANCRDANFMGSDLSGASLEGSDMQGANLVKAEAVNANMKQANMRNATLINAVLIDADLTLAMCEGADFSGAILVQANLIETNFNSAYLRGANLKMAEMEGVHFNDARLTGADLDGAQMDSAKFDHADMRMASMRNTRMMDASFEGTNLSGADLTGILPNNSCFIGANFTGIIFPDAEAIDMHAKTTNMHVFDTENVRVFIASHEDIKNNGDPIAAFYSKEDDETKTCTVVLYTYSGRIAMSACRDFYQGEKLNDVAVSIYGKSVETFFNKNYAFAGNPLDDKNNLGPKDLLDTVMTIERAIDPRLSRAEDLQDMRAALKEAIDERVKDMGLSRGERDDIAKEPSR